MLAVMREPRILRDPAATTVPVGFASAARDPLHVV